MVKPLVPIEVRDVLRVLGVPVWAYVGHDAVRVFTSFGTVEDAWTAPRFAPVDRRPGDGRVIDGWRRRAPKAE